MKRIYVGRVGPRCIPFPYYHWRIIAAPSSTAIIQPHQHILLCGLRNLGPNAPLLLHVMGAILKKTIIRCRSVSCLLRGCCASLHILSPISSYDAISGLPSCFLSVPLLLSSACSFVTVSAPSPCYTFQTSHLISCCPFLLFHGPRLVLHYMPPISSHVVHSLLFQSPNPDTIKIDGFWFLIPPENSYDCQKKRRTCTTSPSAYC